MRRGSRKSQARKKPELLYGRYRFDRKRAARAVGFIQSLVFTDGEWSGQPFKLAPWQRHHIEQIFGWVDEQGFRRYRTVYMEIGRKNGKTELVSAVGLFLLMGDDEEGAQIYSAAKNKPQAGLTFKPSKRRIQMQPALKSRLEIYDGIMRIVYPETGSFWQVLPGSVPGSWGINAHGILFDEVHAQASADLWDALTTSVGSRRQPLIFAITTAGYDRQSICWKLHQRAQRAIAHPELDPSFYGVIYAADEKDDWKQEEVWKKANPNYPMTPKRDYMMDEVRRATEEPAYENTFKRLHLNIWTQQASRFIPMDKWFECPIRTSNAELDGEFCYGGLDLAEVQDLAAFGLIFPPTAKRPYWDGLVQQFCPEDTIHHRSRSDRVPYDVWARDKFIVATPGNAIDFDSIEEVVRAMRSRYKIGAIGYDRWGATQLVQHMNAAGMKTLPVGMGYGSMSAPTKEFLKIILSGKFRHGDNPVMSWQADNLAVMQDTAGNVKPAKNASGDKIDGIVALIAALFCVQELGIKKRGSVYRGRGAMVIGVEG